MDKKVVSIFWFRRDLRLEDNVGLQLALKSAFPVLPVFIFDRNILDKLSTADRRASFIYDTIEKLKAQLETLGCSLYTIYKTPIEAFRILCAEFDVREVFTNHDYEPYAKERDGAIAELLNVNHIPFTTCKDQVIFEKDEIVKGDGKPYTVFTPYSIKWKQKFYSQKLNEYEPVDISPLLLKVAPFPLPTLEAMGFTKASSLIPPPTLDEKLIANYDQTRDIPSLNGTSKLGVHLRFGTISIRKAVQMASNLNGTWLNELIWREFFMMILFHYPHVVSSCFKSKYERIPWRNNEEEFERWCKGETGYPIVDAGMRELNTTGFMHNRVRMVVAGFLTKHLLIDWRWGEAYFAERLMDYELASNNGNWQWAAGCGCDAAPYFRIFNPHAQTTKFDPKGIYIRKWIDDFDNYHIPLIIEHDVARKRALAVFSKALNE